MAPDTVELTEGLRRRWDALWRRVAGRLPDDPSFDRLVASYDAPGRHYHNLHHVADCLAGFDHVRGGCANADAVELAIWFHDLIYDPWRDDNEELSARSAGRALRSVPAPPALFEAVPLIRATAHRAPPATPDERIITDIDLSILGREPAEFDEYERKIRLEYGHVSDEAFAAGRGRVLRAFLRRPRIYWTDDSYSRYEAGARRNLRRSLARLGTGT